MEPFLGRIRDDRQMKMIFKFLGILSIVGLILTGFGFLVFLDNFEIHSDRQVSLVFQQDGNRLEGDLVLPDGAGPHPVILLVHGDGAQDRTAGLGYVPIINHLVDKGIGVFSWDKPGVGQSTGDWLAQSMEDRAAEVMSALATIREQPEVNPKAVGVVGFSQAGWVLPELPRISEDPGAVEPDFYVIVGGAISWAEQSLYLTRKRLEKTGKSETEVAAELTKAKAENERLFHNSPVPTSAFPGMSLSRTIFVHKNYPANSRQGLSRIGKPFLAIMGAEDLNVDARKSVAVYQTLLGQKHPANKIWLVPDASHGLLKAADYNYQLSSQWPFLTQIQFLLEGPDAFSPGILDQLSNWILNQLPAQGA